jgi:hypothetical protein
VCVWDGCLIPGILSPIFLARVSYLSIGLASWHPPCIQLKADLKMMSLFYGLSALLMAAAHYTLCDETSVVEASTGVSMWGDLAAGWLLANHKPLAGLVLTGTIVFSMWVVMSVLQRMDDKAEEEKVELYTVLMAAPAETDMSLTGPYNSGSIPVDPLMRSYMGGDPYRRAKMAFAKVAAENAGGILATPKQLPAPVATPKPLGILATPKPSVPMAAPVETGMSLTGPYNSGSIPVDPLMRSYMGGDPYRRAKMAFAKVAAENAGAGGVFATPKQLGILATPKRHTPDGGFYCGMDRPTSLPRAY